VRAGPKPLCRGPHPPPAGLAAGRSAACHVLFIHRSRQLRPPVMSGLHALLMAEILTAVVIDVVAGLVLAGLTLVVRHLLAAGI
jgi:hypothetical protein